MKKLQTDQNKINYNFKKLLDSTIDTDIEVSIYDRKHFEDNILIDLYLHCKHKMALKLSIYNYYVDEVKFSEIMDSVAAMLMDTDSPYNADIFTEYKSIIEWADLCDTCDTYRIIKEYFDCVYWQDIPLTV